MTSTHVKARNRGLFSTVRQRCVYDKSLVVLIDSEDTRERENVCNQNNREEQKGNKHMSRFYTYRSIYA